METPNYMESYYLQVEQDLRKQYELAKARLVEIALRVSGQLEFDYTEESV